VVNSTFPENLAMRVAPQTTLVATFNEAISPNTINAQTFTLVKNGNTPVAGYVSLSGKSALFRPSADLEAGASYTVSLSSVITDLAGNPLVGGFSWVFSTALQEEDLTPPRVISVFPANGATNVPLDTSLRMTFSEPVQPFAYSIIDGKQVPVEFAPDYRSATIQSTSLLPNAKYESTGVVADLAGNISAPFTWIYYTASQ
jgi:hypothetical protein